MAAGKVPVGAGETVKVAVRVTPANAAVIVTAVLAVTFVVVSVNTRLVAPAVTVTLAGTLATAGLLLASVISAPADGALLVSLRVPCELVPALTLAGFRLRLCKLAGACGGVTVKVDVLVTPLKTAEIVTGVDALTALVEMEKPALAAPASTFTLVGTLASAELLLVSATSAPPVGAPLVNVTVPCARPPPTMLVGLNASADNAAAGGCNGFTVRIAVFVTPPPETEIVTCVATVTRVVKMLKPPAITPNGIITPLFTEATAGLLLEIWKITSVVAGDAMVTIAKELPVPVIEVGLSVSDAGGGCGVSVTCDCALAPFQVAVIVTGVFVATALDGMANEMEALPGRTVTGEIALTAGELLEMLTTAPPGGA